MPGGRMAKTERLELIVEIIRKPRASNIGIAKAPLRRRSGRFNDGAVCGVGQAEPEEPQRGRNRTRDSLRPGGSPSSDRLRDRGMV